MHFYGCHAWTLYIHKLHGFGQGFGDIALPRDVGLKNGVLVTCQVSPVFWNWSTVIRSGLIVWVVEGGMCFFLSFFVTFQLRHHIDMTEPSPIAKPSILANGFNWRTAPTTWHWCDLIGLGEILPRSLMGSSIVKKNVPHPISWKQCVLEQKLPEKLTPRRTGLVPYIMRS